MLGRADSDPGSKFITVIKALNVEKYDQIHRKASKTEPWITTTATTYTIQNKLL